MRTLARLEILRVLRNRKFMFFSVLYPVLLFMILDGSTRRPRWCRTTWSRCAPSAP